MRHRVGRAPRWPPLRAAGAACRGRPPASGKPAVIVLGFDGMDYALTKQMMAEGRLPNLSRLAARAAFQPLGTSMPPQSPVAWSNFITGLDAGGHGIFDFVHRDPKTMIPYLSTSRAEASDKTLKLGKYQIPLGSDKVELLRHGQPFWEVLEKRGIADDGRPHAGELPALRQRHPRAVRHGHARHPRHLRHLLLLHDGAVQRWAGKDVSGGKVYDVAIDEGVVEGKLYGPDEPVPGGARRRSRLPSRSTSTPWSRSPSSWWAARSAC